MLDKAIYVPLFTELSGSVNSPFFHINPGEIAMLQGFGFMDYKERADVSELQVEQAACLEMLVFKEDTFCDNTERLCSMKQYYTALLAREIMRVNGCAVSISKNNNIILLDIPGSYCLTLNDGTAIGTARVYLRIFTTEEYIRNSKLFIGER